MTPESSPASAAEAPGRHGQHDRYPFFRPGDAVLVAAVLVVAILLMDRGEGPARDMTVGTPGGGFTVSLDRDTVFTVEGRLGGVRVEVLEGSARVADSPCPGRYCVRQGWIGSPGETAVCAPSAVWLRIEGGDAPDAVTY